jgi:hypothetical protein
MPVSKHFPLPVLTYVPVFTLPCTFPQTLLCLHSHVSAPVLIIPSFLCLSTLFQVSFLTLLCAFSHTPVLALTLPYASHHTSPPMSSHFPLYVLTLLCPCPHTSRSLFSQFPVPVLSLPCALSCSSRCLFSDFHLPALTFLSAWPRNSQYLSSHFLIPCTSLFRLALPCSCPHASQCLSSHLLVLVPTNLAVSVLALPCACRKTSCPALQCVFSHFHGLSSHFPVQCVHVLTIPSVCPNSSLCLSCTFFCMFSNFHDLS